MLLQMTDIRNQEIRDKLADGCSITDWPAPDGSVVDTRIQSVNGICRPLDAVDLFCHVKSGLALRLRLVSPCRRLDSRRRLRDERVGRVGLRVLGG